MEHLVRMGLLFDFYGELLTPKQQKVFSLYYLQNLSLGEIAEEEATSRQAVHDLLQRTEKLLEKWEGKLHLLDQYQQHKRAFGEVDRALKSLEKQLPSATEMETAFCRLKKSVARLAAELDLKPEGEDASPLGNEDALG
ncbi:MAG: putative DNA-binding protein [Firmicutes bacterium]|nr:putative DNA-binding protein [Bacillota bacterium]